MNSAALRPYVTAGVALVGAGLITVAPLAARQSDVMHHAVWLTSNGDIVVASNGVPGIDATLGPGEVTIAYESGGSTVPEVPASQLTNANEVYVQPNYPGAVPHYLGYPAQFYPFSATQGGYHDHSEAVGQQIWNNALMTQLGEGHNVVFYGTSQSATIQTLEMIYLMSLPADEQPSATQLGFVDYGDPNLPDGGLYTRFGYPELPANDNVMPFGLPGHLNLPSIGIAFSDPTPANAPWPDVIYTGEYDGFADSPQYSVNLLADVNAILGTAFVHAHGSAKPASLIATAELWQTSPGYDGNTTYFIIPTPDLPLLDQLRFYVPVIGNPLADLLQPDLKVLVNLGYGPDNVGYSEYPNVWTPASGLFPDVNPTTVLNELVAGAKEGVQNFQSAVSEISPSQVTAALTELAEHPLSSITGIASGLTLGFIPQLSLPTITPDALDPSNFTTELETVLTLNNDVLTAVPTAIDNIASITGNDALNLVTLAQDDLNLTLAGLSQLADGNVNGALTTSTEVPNLSVGLGAVWIPFVELESVGSQSSLVESAIQSAVTADLNFLAGLPGLL